MLPDSKYAFPYPPIEVQHQLKSFDEFNRLRAIVVGSPAGANHPEIDITFENFFQPPLDPEVRRQAVGPVPNWIISEIEEDIEEFVRVLLGAGVEVHRPAPWDSTCRIRTPFWECAQFHSLMPRDSLLVFGDLMIESPSPTRSRYFETFPFRAIIEGYVEKGAHVIAAPKPMLTEISVEHAMPLGEREVLFDAANCIRLGRDVFIDVNRSANRKGFQWLQTTLKRFVSSDVRVTPICIGTDHLDVTLIPLRPGVLLIDPLRVGDDNLPPQFSSWDKVIVEEVMPIQEYRLPYPLASNDGIGRNVLMLAPDTVVVDDVQLPLIRALEKRRFTVIPLRYRHGRTLGGSWHCITLDTHREGELVSYFD